MVTSTTSTTAASTTSSLVSALGGGSGIDMQALATNLSVAQFAARNAQIDNQSATLDREISAASTIKSKLLGLSTALGDRVRTGDLAPLPSIANTAVATPSRGTLTGTTGSYSLEVTSLAASQTLTTSSFAASTTPVGSGTLTLHFGTIAGTGTGATFTEDTAHAAVPLSIAAGATLADVASAINGSNSGVSAYVANTANGAQLVLKGQQGAANGFTLEASETPGDPGLSALAWTPAAAPAKLIARSADAAFKLDGVAMTSPTNTLTDVAPGLSLALTGTNPGAPTQIGFSDATSAITAAMTDLTSALNDIMAEIATDSDPTGGDLSKDSGTRTLKRAFGALAGTVVMPNAPAGTPRTLSDLGLATNRDGTFTLDTTRLTATLKSNPAAAAAMFTNGLYGVYSTVDALARKATAASDPNALGGSITRYTAQKAKLATTKTTIAADQEKLRLSLSTRFAHADSNITQSHSTLSFIQGQIAVWNKSGN
ncbi:flagellar filament capping protein FliD [Novosphingobium lentum]|uniref:flagellar filament capping protein FliD n=1 Tax=Novosphingobium lentum TaxID=145287 RepID=UPI00082C3542|nr:flagellar filament capping protein FliD [Novosphingobium lentum]